ncbi:hypothetical protein RISK_006756 [Rhodopirellula islandica]|uniref:Uncharacterized protein n=1 Tax=Rhodopirellula islandica TaxID=595434 RepID=A0A0J1B334_RHOIS|nr:hypothetical protein RISK_006756 [Rhodopirellula islandica]
MALRRGGWRWKRGGGSDVESLVAGKQGIASVGGGACCRTQVYSSLGRGKVPFGASKEVEDANELVVSVSAPFGRRLQVSKFDLLDLDGCPQHLVIQENCIDASTNDFVFDRAGSDRWLGSPRGIRFCDDGNAIAGHF